MLFQQLAEDAINVEMINTSELQVNASELEAFF